MIFDKISKTACPEQPSAMSILPPPGPFPAPVTEIEPYAQNQAKNKNDEGAPLHQLRIKIGPRKLQDQEMYVGPAFIMIAQMPPHHPMRVRTQTIAPTIPYSQNEPGHGREQQRSKIPFSGRPESPSGTIEQGQGGMKDKEENIQEMVPHGYVLRMLFQKLLCHTQFRPLRSGIRHHRQLSKI